MFRRALSLAATALTAAATLPGTAHAGSAFRTFTSRAAYLAAVTKSNATSRPQITSGAGATIDETGTHGNIGDVYFFTSSPGATFTPRTSGGVLDLAAGSTGTGTFSFASGVVFTPPVGQPVPISSTFGLGVSFTANTAGSFVARVGNPGQVDTAAFDFAAGDAGFVGFVFEPDQQQLLQSLALDVPANGSVTVTGVDVATVPEPATVALVGAGVAAVGFAGRRRRKPAAA